MEKYIGVTHGSYVGRYIELRAYGRTGLQHVDNVKNINHNTCDAGVRRRFRLSVRSRQSKYG